MGKSKRHYKGSNNAQDRKRRKEAEEKWRGIRHDEPSASSEITGGDGRGNSNSRSNGTWNTEPFENKRFEAFYEAQNFLKDEEDIRLFLHSLVQPLPASFRLYTDNPFIEQLRRELVQFIDNYHQLQQQKLQSAPKEAGEGEGEGEVGLVAESASADYGKSPLEQIAWYPNGSGYKLSLDRRSIRKRPELAALHQWMIQHTDNGNITRQEAVSMVPPIALDVHPHHKCLDLCAAPGSKTSQLLEIVNRSLKPSNEEGEQGLVVANDADTDRAYMLVHQCRRINSPSLIVTTHQGQSFPSIIDNPSLYQERGRRSGQEFFDRVLCDVPCSGDGTLRKNPAIWPKWNTSMSAVMHPLQLMISRRGLQLLKSGGLMVYSTCSMSPYENESVVAELLRCNKGKLELVDARQFLPLLKARRGLSHWNVFDDHLVVKKENQAKREAAKLKQQQQQQQRQQQQQLARKQEEMRKEECEVVQSEERMIVDTATDEVPASEEHVTALPSEDQANIESESAKIEDYSHITDPAIRKCLAIGMLYFSSFEEVPNSVKWKYRQSIFPPTAEEAEWMHLERCLRCVPHDEDTGGFFVATLRKIEEASIENVEEQPQSRPPQVISEEETKATEEAIAFANAIEAGEGGVPSGNGNNSKGNNKNKGKSDNNSNMVKYHLWDDASFQQMKQYYQFDDAITSSSFYVREDLALLKGKSAPTSAKTIYYFPPTVQALLHGDVHKQLKVVTAGVKAFEKKGGGGNQTGNVTQDYRLLQECLPFLHRHIHSRKILVTIQDFSNLLEGGLVSFSTLSSSTLQLLSSLSSGIVICSYSYQPADVLSSNGAQDREKIEGNFEFSMVCWKGTSPCLNVMCNKIDLQSFKHRLTALRVLRSKILATKKIPTSTESKQSSEGDQGEEGIHLNEAEEQVDGNVEDGDVNEGEDGDDGDHNDHDNDDADSL